MACPTKEEYEEALEKKKYLSDTVGREYKHRETLINELCTSQKMLDTYKQLLDNAKEIILRYETYQEIYRDSVANIQDNRGSYYGI